MARIARKVIRSYRLFIVNKNKLNTLLIEKTINWLCFRWLYWTNKWSSLNFQNLRSILRLYRFGNTAIDYTFYHSIYLFVIDLCLALLLQGCVASLETYQSSKRCDWALINPKLIYVVSIGLFRPTLLKKQILSWILDIDDQYLILFKIPGSSWI